MTRIYLIRHAEAEGNLYRIVQGQGNSNLTDRGWRQVKALEQRFSPIHIDAVYASDLYRTCATASAVYKPKGLPLHRRTDLREIFVGGWEQRTWGDIARTSPQQMEYFSHRPDLWHCEGAETAAEVLARVKAAICAIAAENVGRTVAVFSHGYAIRLLLAHLQGYPPERIGESPTGQNTAVSLLEAEGGRLRLVFRDDISHLQTPEYLAGEKVRRKSDPLEPGLWFAPLEEADPSVCTRLLRECWDGVSRPFDPSRFLSSAARRPTLVGFSRETPVGLVQLGPERGWISLACIRADHRSRGFGGQLIGQAVQWTRALGGEALYAALTPGGGAESFFRDYGFVPTGRTEDGRAVFTKDIRFDPEFLTPAT